MIELRTFARDGKVVEQKVFANGGTLTRVVGRVLPQSHFDEIEARMLMVWDWDYRDEVFLLRRNARRDVKRSRLLGIVRSLAAKHRRTPTTQEIGAVLRPRAKAAVQASLAWKLGTHYFGSYNDLIRTAGCVPRHQGERVA